MVSTGLRIQDLTFGSLFKIMFSAALAFWLITGVAIGLAAMFGLDTVNFNGTYLYGIAGLIVGIVLALVLGGLFGALGAALGALLLKLLGPILPLGMVRAARAPAEPAVELPVE